MSSFSGSVCHFDIALLRKFTSRDDLALTVPYRSLIVFNIKVVFL